ncbi:hypothetical protein [Sporosarcina sp. YIM B06819]|uniref:hypothetical protein n=1 Tax=Sporosarcina sp. YIM B06819 TaxID=3081769 RepID=UPI00298CF691|nr:hypothetical protein [Sporosarcina sp. YIM B06819]
MIQGEEGLPNKSIYYKEAGREMIRFSLPASFGGMIRLKGSISLPFGSNCGRLTK